MKEKNSLRKILFFLNHPAHFHLFKNVVQKLCEDQHQVKVLIVKKDILEDLVKRQGWEYDNLFPEGRRSKKGLSIFAMAFYLMKTEFRLWKAVRRERPDILVGTEGTLAHVGRLLGVPAILFNEDDTHVTPENYLFYPFATKIVVPHSCDVGKWEKKKVTYQGYHELAYLHPLYFTPDENVVKAINPQGTRYFILRLAELSASHDLGKKGIDDDLAQSIINLLEQHGRVFISAERPLKPEFEKYRLNINPLDIFHVMYFADIYIGDSQSMAMEAANLGTPCVRFNDFVGMIGVLEELEKIYQLTIGIKISEREKLFSTLEDLLNTPELKRHWQNKRKRMLVEKIDVADFFVECIEDQLNTQAK